MARHFIGLVLALVAWPSCIQAAERQVEPRELWSSVLAESEAKWGFKISSDEDWNGSVQWRLSHGARTLVSGERALKVTAAEAGLLELPFKWPALKGDASLALELSISVDTTTFKKPVWVLSKDPFAGRSEWLKKLNLHVFDPDEQTIDCFEKMDVPFKHVKSQDAIADIESGLLVIGEGISFVDRRRVMSAAFAAAERGIPVLCLASREGTFEGPAEKPLAGLQLRRRDVLREWDKRFDIEQWSADLTAQMRGLKVKQRDDRQVVEHADEADGGWAVCEWLIEGECDGQPVRTRVVWLGFRVIEAWDVNPTPRHLLGRALERLSQ